MPDAVPCARHPKTETRLTCGKCDTPICPRCWVDTPVGARCRDCARLRRVPTFDVRGPALARAAAASLGAGAAGGIAFVVLSPLLYRLPMLDVVAVAAVGYGVGAGVSAAANRKRGRRLQAVAAAGMLVAYAVITFFGVVNLTLPGLLGLLVAVYLATAPFR